MDNRLLASEINGIHQHFQKTLLLLFVEGGALKQCAHLLPVFAGFQFVQYMEPLLGNIKTL